MAPSLPSPRDSKRIVLTTIGSLGDLHPYLALALGLKARGHHPIVATSEAYRPRVESLGVEFHPIPPDLPDPETAKHLMKEIMDQRKGSERVIRDFVMPHLRGSYQGLLAACSGASLLVSHVITYAAPLVAEKTGIPWASTVLAPIGFFSAYDPPVLAPAPFLARIRGLGPWFHRPLFGFLKWSVRSWADPWHQLRTELGLPPTRANPIFEGQHSPRLALCLFSPLLAKKQPDWPSQTVLTGFPFFEEPGERNLPPDLAEFLDNGAPPIVFTLGSSAVMDAGAFYEHGAAAARLLGHRALLLIGSDPANRPVNLPKDILACEYAPFASVFPRAAAIVHQGGVGTTAQAMRSGRPMLVMPYSHDQPDNAARMVRLGIGRTIHRGRFTSASAAAELRPLLEKASYALRAAEVGTRIRQEDGIARACEELDKMI